MRIDETSPCKPISVPKLAFDSMEPDLSKSRISQISLSFPVYFYSLQPMQTKCFLE